MASIQHLTPQLVALNSASEGAQASLQAIALNTEGGAAPDWIELIPAGPNLYGRDSCGWKMASA